MNLLFEADGAAVGMPAKPLIFAAWQPSVEATRVSAPPDTGECKEAAVQRQIDVACGQVAAALRDEHAGELEEIRREERAACRSALDSFRRERGAYFAAVETEIVQLAMAIATRVLMREAQADGLLLRAVVRVALEKVRGEERTTLLVPEDDVPIWSEHLAVDTSVRVEGDAAMQRGDCRLVAASGVAELGLQVQMAEVERGFCDLMARRPA